MTGSHPGTSSFAAFVADVETTATAEELEQLEAAREFYKREAERLKDDGEDNPRVPA